MLGPWTPLLFQGQEFGATTPFLYFADRERRVARDSARRPVRISSQQFPDYAAPETQAQLADPVARETFHKSKLDLERAGEIPAALRALSRSDSTAPRTTRSFRARNSGAVDGAVLGAQAFVLRFFDSLGRRRSAARDQSRAASRARPVVPEPLLAPPEPERGWETLLGERTPALRRARRAAARDRSRLEPSGGIRGRLAAENARQASRRNHEPEDRPPCAAATQ